MIYELLAEGRENATTGRELAKLCNCDLRAITAQIERERRDGHPICATSGGDPSGYYMPANDEELRSYCECIQRRALELLATRRVLIRVLERRREALNNGQI